MTARPDTSAGSGGASLRRSALTLLSGTSAALALTFALQPVLTRLYEPTSFGLADAFVSVVALLVPFASLRYEDAIMAPDNDDDAADIVRLAFGVLAVVTLVLAALIPFRSHLAGFLRSPQLAPWLLLVPFAVLAYRWSELLELWSTRRKRFGHVSAAAVTRASVMGGTRVGVGVTRFSASPAGLIGGFVVGFVASALLLGYTTFRERAGLFGRTTIKRLKAAATRYRHFPFFGMPSNLLSALISRLPFLLLLLYFGEATVGYYGRAYAAIAVPLSVVGSSVAQAFFVHAAEEHRRGSVLNITDRVHQRMVMVSAFPAIGVMVAGPAIFSSIFGAEWEAAGSFAQIVCPWFVAAGIASPLTRLFDVTERQRLDFGVGAVMFVVQTAALVVGGLTGDIKTALWLVAAGGLAARVFQISTIMHLAGVPWGRVLQPYATYAVRSLPGLVLLVPAALYSNRWIVLVAFAVGLAMYGAWIGRDEMERSRPTPSGR